MYKVKLNPEHGKQIADAYENATHQPNHPETKASYGALSSEIGSQFKDMMSKGIKISKIKPGQDNPYKTSKDLHHDIKNNKHMWYFPTEQGYGSDGKDTSNHPLLQPSEFHHEGQVMPHNDIFRVVHDYMGHHLGGESGFGPKGEHQAYLSHKTTLSPLAQKALASETLMQNSVVNYGKNGEHNRKNPSNTIYADQKSFAAPDWIVNGNWHE